MTLKCFLLKSQPKRFSPERLVAPALLALAAFLPGRAGGGDVRLIDNRVLRPQPAPEGRS